MIDVLIAGGGLAGSAAAIQLARIGFSVELFERASFPREKPCGEALLLRQKRNPPLPFLPWKLLPGFVNSTIFDFLKRARSVGATGLITLSETT